MGLGRIARICNTFLCLRCLEIGNSIHMRLFVFVSLSVSLMDLFHWVLLGGVIRMLFHLVRLVLSMCHFLHQLSYWNDWIRIRRMRRMIFHSF